MKKTSIFISLFILVAFFSGFSEDKHISNNITNFTASISYVPTEKESIAYNFQAPFVGNSFNGFREAIAFKESQGKYHVTNSFGYLGKYQFGKSTLERFKIYDTQEFLETPELQEDAFVALCSVNKWILRKDIKRSVGKTINGIEITESGILAAAHLSGAGNVKKYLRSNGSTKFKDAYGSSIQHYIKKFSGYDTSFIEANQKATI
ncbi:peptidoglycan-binding protein LysM [Lutibacter holmesii]|uniref:Peptidoglycan-binding protein LysM n=1 Tax=Lutibacter holmesii TaxID=1137985 RepID=A0ABW3WPY5_9FLAO